MESMGVLSSPPTFSPTVKYHPFPETGHTDVAIDKNIWTILSTNSIIEMLCSLIVAILNLVEMIILKRLKRKLRVYEIILLSLSCSDFLISLSNITRFIVVI